MMMMDLNKTVDLNKINEELNKISDKLFITSSVEDYCEQDKEEYGIEDLEETRHLTLQAWVIKGMGSIVVKEYFSFDVPSSLFLTEEQKDVLKRFELTTDEIYSVMGVLMKYAK